MMCPCGCGQSWTSLGIVRSGGAKIWSHLGEIQPVLQEAITKVGPYLNDEQRSNLANGSKHLAEVKMFAAQHMHRTATPRTTPDLTVLGEESARWTRWSLSVVFDAQELLAEHGVAFNVPPAWES